MRDITSRRSFVHTNNISVVVVVLFVLVHMSSKLIYTSDFTLLGWKSGLVGLSSGLGQCIGPVVSRVPSSCSKPFGVCAAEDPDLAADLVLHLFHQAPAR